MITQLCLIPLGLGVIKLKLNSPLFIIVLPIFFKIFVLYSSFICAHVLPIVLRLSCMWDGEMEKEMEVERMDRRHCQSM